MSTYIFLTHVNGERSVQGVTLEEYRNRTQATALKEGDTDDWRNCISYLSGGIFFCGRLNQQWSDPCACFSARATTSLLATY